MSVEIQPYTGNFDELLPLLQMSMGFDAPDGVRHLLTVEQARGTRYFTACLDGQMAGLIGLYVDLTGAVEELEPPQIIDLAVYPQYRRAGLARALVAYAEDQVRAAGRRRVWLYTDGNNAGLLAFYRRLGYRLAAAVPDYFGDGTVKAIFRKDL
jgi:ribosomal protein S18 acetylase RimI-like enzyme